MLTMSKEYSKKVLYLIILFLMKDTIFIKEFGCEILQRRH
jgi:hypothetical protein